MANPGKNKTARWLRVYANGYNLSGDARTVGTMRNSFDPIDLTGWSESIKNGTFGQRNVGVDSFMALLNDATAGAYAILKTRPVTVVSFLFGGGAEPAVGDPAYLLGAVQLSDAHAWDGGAASIGTNFEPSYTNTDDCPWGYVLSEATSLSATTNKASVDIGTGAVGWNANLHVTASSGGTWSIIIQQSATDAWAGEETTLATFVADGSAIAYERQSGTGAVARYVRSRSVRSGGTVTPVITFARNN